MSRPELTDIRIDTPADGVVRLTLDRADAGNALSTKLAAQLQAATRWLRFESEARAAIITGSGRFFCAGADLKERDRPTWWLWDVRAAIDSLEQVEIPIVAAINGTCLGGGLELALACDVRIAGQNVQLGLPEITFGALPAAGGPTRLTRLVGPGRAKQLILTGERFNGTQAAAYGVVELAVPDAELAERASQLAATIAGHAGYATRTAKQLINAAVHQPIAAPTMEYVAIDGMASEEERAQAAQAAMERSATYRKLLG